MKKEKTVSLKYIYRVVEEAGIKIPEYRYKQIMMNFTKRYHNCLYQLAGLSSSARDLLDYLTERMDDNNIVYSSAITRKNFLEFIEGITDGKITYSDSTVKKAFASLVEKKILFPKGRGAFQVNPEYFWKQNEEKRMDQIQLELEFNREDDMSSDEIKDVEYE